MSDRFEPDPLDALRDADPVDVDRLSSASLARLRARVREDVMTTEASERRRWRPAGIAALASAAVVGVLAVAMLSRGGGATPSLQPGGSAGTGSAMCVEQYSPATLANRTFAFEGTVSEIDGDRVSFTINQGYRGADEPTITLDAAGMTGTTITSAGGPNLQVGERYLVAGDDHFVWACGFTQPYDPLVAQEWASALSQ